MTAFVDELYKVIYRITHKKTYRHNRKRWPYVKIERNDSGELTRLVYKKTNIPLVTLSSIKGKYSGPILVTATGPSVNDIHFNDRPVIPVMGVNGSYALKSKMDFKFYVLTDIHFPEHRPDILADVVSDSDILLFATVDIIVSIIKNIPCDKVNCRFAAIEDYEDKIYEEKKTAKDVLRHLKHIPSIYSSDSGEVGFSSDISNGVFSGKTVVYWALQIMVHLGFESIYIIGLDMNNFNKPRFYETDGDKIHTQLSDDMESVLSSFEHASTVLKDALGVNVVNLSMVSSIPETIFKKADYSDYEKNICLK